MQRNNALDELIQLSFRTEERLVMPLIIDYFSKIREGYSQEEALVLVGKQAEQQRKRPYRTLILRGTMQDIEQETAKYSHR